MTLPFPLHTVMLYIIIILIRHVDIKWLVQNGKWNNYSIYLIFGQFANWLCVLNVKLLTVCIKEEKQTQIAADQFFLIRWSYLHKKKKSFTFGLERVRLYIYTTLKQLASYITVYKVAHILMNIPYTYCNMFH